MSLVLVKVVVLPFIYFKINPLFHTIKNLLLTNAHLLQTQAHRLGALYRIDELAPAHSLFNDVTEI